MDTSGGRVRITDVSRTGRHSSVSGGSFALWVLLGQDDLRQRVARARLGYCVVGVDDRRASVLQIDRNFKQIEQIARSGRTAGAVRTDHTGVIRRVAHFTLREAGAIVRRLGQIDVPNGTRIVFARGGRPVIDDFHRVVVRGDPGKERRASGREVHSCGERPSRALVAGRRERDVMCIRPNRVELAVRRIYRQRGENVAQVGEQRGVKNQMRGPAEAAVSAARNNDVIEGCAGALLHTRLARGVDCVDVVRERIGHDGSLGVVERRIASKATLAHDRITDAVPVQAVIIGALYVDQRAVCRVVIGDVHRRAVRSDPLAIGSSSVDDLRGAAACAGRRRRTGDG